MSVVVYRNAINVSAEKKLRDKLAAAMREKMTQVTANTRDKSLQAERKRKAAMFVNMLKSKHKGTISSTPIGMAAILITCTCVQYCRVWRKGLGLLPVNYR